MRSIDNVTCCCSNRRSCNASTVITTQRDQPYTRSKPCNANAPPAVEEWGDDFDGDQLDETKWEPYTFEGGGGGKIEVKDKQLKMRGSGGSRSGVRSKQTFRGERFYVEAALAKGGPTHSGARRGSLPAGFAIVAVLFDGNSDQPH